MALFDVAIQKFLKNLAQKSKIRKGYVSETTTETYTGILDKFRAFTEKKELSEVTQDDVISFLAGVKDQGTAGSTVNLYHSCLSSFYQFAEKEYNDIRNFMPMINRAIVHKEEAKCPTEEEIRALLDYLKKSNKARRRDAIMIEFMLRTGARISEICSLDIDSIALSPISINIRFRGKGNKYREIPIPIEKGTESARFAERLKEYINKYRKTWKITPGNEKAFFLSNHGNRLTDNAIQRTFKYYAKKVNLQEYSAHATRHYFATRLISQGVDIPTVSKLLGHSSPQVTMSIYAHTDTGKMEKGMKKVFVRL
jgi:site-specific recombinase XerD